MCGKSTAHSIAQKHQQYVTVLSHLQRKIKRRKTSALLHRPKRLGKRRIDGRRKRSRIIARPRIGLAGARTDQRNVARATPGFDDIEIHRRARRTAPVLMAVERKLRHRHFHLGIGRRRTCRRHHMPETAIRLQPPLDRRTQKRGRRRGKHIIGIKRHRTIAPLDDERRPIVGGAHRHDTKTRCSEGSRTFRRQRGLRQIRTRRYHPRARIRRLRRKTTCESQEANRHQQFFHHSPTLPSDRPPSALHTFPASPPHDCAPLPLERHIRADGNG